MQREIDGFYGFVWHALKKLITVKWVQIKDHTRQKKLHKMEAFSMVGEGSYFRIIFLI